MNILILASMLMGCSNKVFKLKNKTLLKAAQNGNVKEIKELLAAGANINTTNTFGWTALIIAAQYGHAEAIRALVKAGAKVNDVQQDGRTALILAAQEGHLAAIRALLAVGAKINLTNTFGWTALMYAAQEGHAAAIKELIEAGANVHHANKDGDTALMWTARHGHLLTFMRVYAKVAFDLPEDAPETVIFNTAFSLLLQLLDQDIFNTDIFIKKKTFAIIRENIKEFLLHPLLDLSFTVTKQINDVTIQINAIKTVYEHLLIDVFNQINSSSIRDKMLDIVVNGWDIPTKRKILRSIFRNPKLNEILLGRDQSKKKGLRDMLRLLLLGGVYCPELNISKEQIYKVFEDEIETVGKDIEQSIVLLLINIGWK